MLDIWHNIFFRFISAFYFTRIKLIHPERIPQNGPVLYLGLHRNGAVDGYVYHRVLPAPVFMISTQLLKNWFSRLFFRGIAVTRNKDKGNRALNDASLHHCLQHLRGGGELFVFPEGTSSLAPCHLTFKSGAVWLLLDYLATDGPPIHVIPLGIHYECPWAFRAKVEVVAGLPISTALPADTSRLDSVHILKRRFRAALEEVGVNVSSAEYQEMIQRIAYVATLATPRSYFKSLKALEHHLPEEILSAWKILEPGLHSRNLLYHQGVPLFPMGSLALYTLQLLVSGPVVVMAILLNLPTFLGAWAAARKFPDDRNVISLWKILAGVPLFILWTVAITLILLLAGKPLLWAAYVLLTWAGLQLYYSVKKLAFAVHNGIRYPELRASLLDFRRIVLESLPDETA